MYLVLENGKVFEGEGFGAEGEAEGEVVFCTAMTGYLETLTDKSYYGQIIVQTFPLIGNYGVIPADFEGKKISARAYIVKDWCRHPSNFRSEGNLDELLKAQNITGLCGIDTRALTKIIRENGVVNGRITSDPKSVNFSKLKSYKITDAVDGVSVKAVKRHTAEQNDTSQANAAAPNNAAQRAVMPNDDTAAQNAAPHNAGKYKIALIDYGFKENIRRELSKRGCDVYVLPASSTLSDVLEVKPDGIMLSNGPGDPADNTEAIKTLRRLTKCGVPIFGICLGHQLLALSYGFKTKKLKYGHRGANQPVKDLSTGRVYITSQNHGYAVLSDSVNAAVATELFVNVNDKTCEGLQYKNDPVLSVQFHPEASGGPRDTAFLFDRFLGMIEKHK
jgi:carbamoyl-phosphate synthase small subunit